MNPQTHQQPSIRPHAQPLACQLASRATLWMAILCAPVLPACVVRVGGADLHVAAAQHVAMMGDVRELSIDGMNGAIEILHDPTVPGISVTAGVRCRDDRQDQAEARAAGSRLVAERDADGRVAVRVDIPPRACGDPWSSDSVRYTIRGSGLEAVAARTSNGSIVIRGLAARIEAHTSNGPIELESVNGAVRATTSNGGIRADLSPGAVGELDLRTSNGAVQLDLPTSWNGLIRATTSNGTIRLPGAESSEGSAEALLGDATKAKACISTSNGRVTVRQSAQ